MPDDEKSAAESPGEAAGGRAFGDGNPGPLPVPLGDHPDHWLELPDGKPAEGAKRNQGVHQIGGR